MEVIEQAEAQLQQILGGTPELRSVFAERVAEGFYINIEVNRLEAARYGLTVADVPSSTKTLKQQPSKGPYKDCGQN